MNAEHLSEWLADHVNVVDVTGAGDAFVAGFAYATVHSANVTQSLDRWIYFSEEVKAAKQSGKPMFALESTIISHGMPYPTNVQTAREVEEIVRSYGAVPATIAVLNGRIQIGLSDEDLEFLGRPENLDSIVKVSRRDLAYVLAQGRSGATTVAATMICTILAGIEVFVTGGVSEASTGEPNRRWTFLRI